MTPNCTLYVACSYFFITNLHLALVNKYRKQCKNNIICKIASHTLFAVSLILFVSVLYICPVNFFL